MNIQMKACVSHMVLSEQWTLWKNLSLSETVAWLVGKEQNSYTFKPDFIYFWKTKANRWSYKYTDLRKKWFQRLVEKYRIIFFFINKDKMIV